jgi:cytoskeletal protein CcmA (bactofilin family)
MALFRRSRKQEKTDKAPPSDGSKAVAKDSLGTSPQRVGVVSGVLTTSANSDDASLFGSVVERRFGPEAGREKDVTLDPADKSTSDVLARRELLHAAEQLLDDEEAESRYFEFDPMGQIGTATTIVGKIVAKEDLEIQGTIDGSVRLVGHRLVVGSEGVVNATVEARTIQVIGRIMGNVIATESVEIKAGGVIGGDVKSPRIIMADGAIVVGALDMSAALPSPVESTEPRPLPPERPKLIKVELSDEPFADEASA